MDRIEWDELAISTQMGFSSEIDMWNHLYPNLSRRGIGDLLGVAGSTITRRLKKLRFQLRPKGYPTYGNCRLPLKKQIKIIELLDKRLPVRIICLQMGVSETTIYRYKKRRK